MTPGSKYITCPVHVSALRAPDDAALLDGRTTITYRELESRIGEYERTLSSSGIRRGDRVAILAANSIDYAIAIFTLYRLGSTAIPLNLRQLHDWWKDSLAKVGCKLLLTDRERLDRAGDLGFPVLPIGSKAGNGGLQPDRSPAPDGESYTVPEDLETTIIFTSGSGGTPRGVILTYGNHLANALGSNANLPLTRGDRWLAVLPFYHVGGMAILFRSALAGSAVYVPDRFDAGRINELIDESKISHLSLVPAMLERLIEARDYRPYPDSLKAVLLGGGPAAVNLIEKIARIGIPVLTTYGMTEAASQVATLSPDDPTSGLRSSGKPLSHCEVKIIDGAGKPVKAGERGEICIRGKSVFKGYLGEDNHSVTGSGGWYRTGDVGRFDEDGYLHVTGRLDEMFISGGENIHPRVIETRAMEVPGVIECAVVPVDDRMWGQRPALFVKIRVKDYPGRDDLKDHLERHLPPIMLPVRIIEIDEFQRTAIGKIDRVALRGLVRK